MSPAIGTPPWSRGIFEAEPHRENGRCWPDGGRGGGPPRKLMITPLRLGLAGTLRRDLPTAYLAEARGPDGTAAGAVFDGKNGGFYPYAADGNSSSPGQRRPMTGPCRRAMQQRRWFFSPPGRLTGRPAGGPPPICSWAIWLGPPGPYPAGHGFAMLVFLEELWPSAELVCAAQTMPEELAAFLRRPPGPN